MKWITTAKRRAGLSLLLVLGILLTLFIAYGLAPFGDGSLVVDDADIQYLDFFLYYKMSWKEGTVFPILSVNCWAGRALPCSVITWHPR